MVPFQCKPTVPEFDDPIPLERVLSDSALLPRGFYTRRTVEVARALLGKILVHHETAARIVEVEAYLGGDDLAAHSAAGLTERTRVIFGPPGHAYVYLIYGMYECLNLVAEPEGIAGCVLIRAVEPLAGLDRMRRRRAAARKPRDLASGPGKLTRAMAISRKQNGADVTGGGALQVREMRSGGAFEIVTTPRIGISRCADWPLRFYVAGSLFVSGSTSPARAAEPSSGSTGSEPADRR